MRRRALPISFFDGAVIQFVSPDSSDAVLRRGWALGVVVVVVPVVVVALGVRALAEVLPPPKVGPLPTSFVQFFHIKLAMNSHIPAGYAAVGETLNASPSAVLPIISSW